MNLRELTGLAIDTGRSHPRRLADNFSALLVTELLSRSSTAQSRFNDFFRQALRREREDINQLRIDRIHRLK